MYIGPRVFQRVRRDIRRKSRRQCRRGGGGGRGGGASVRGFCHKDFFSQGAPYEKAAISGALLALLVQKYKY